MVKNGGFELRCDSAKLTSPGWESLRSAATSQWGSWEVPRTTFAATASSRQVSWVRSTVENSPWAEHRFDSEAFLRVEIFADFR